MISGGGYSNRRVQGLVPARNAASFIQDTLDSLADQSYPDVHYLISDDASVDQTGSICRRLANQDERFALVQQPENLGWIGNVNWLLRHANADYVFLAYHDDIFDRDYVKDLVEALSSSPSAVVAFPDVRITDEGGHSTVYSYTHLDGLSTVESRIMALLRNPAQLWLPHRGLMDLRMISRVGGPCPIGSEESGADRPWVIRMALEGDFVRVAAPHIHKFRKSTGTSANWKRGYRRTARVRHAEALAAMRADIPMATKVSLYLMVLDRCVRILLKSVIGGGDN